MAATIEISIPDTLADALGCELKDLPRRTIEALVVQAYRGAKISHAEAAEILGLNRWETDALLKGANAHRNAEIQEFASDLEALRNLSSK